MDAILTALETLSGVKPAVLLHAPFHHPANVTPYASLKPVLDYDFNLCAGRSVAVFASRDKAETLGILAQAFRHGPSSVSVFWPNDMGGKGLKDHLKKLGVEAWQDARLHARLAHIPDPGKADRVVLGQWLASAEAKPVEQTGLKAEAGLFSYRQVDTASRLLLASLPERIEGHVADFGCGWGYLGDAVLKRYAGVRTLTAIDDDVRATERTRANIQDLRLETLHADIIQDTLPRQIDAIVMNPPFHAHGKENRILGQVFVERAAASLKKNGMLYMVANRHLPYENLLMNLYSSVTLLADKHGFKIISAQKG